MALRRGDFVAVYIGGTPALIASQESCSLEMTQEVIDVTSKEDNGQFQGIAGMRQQTLSFEGKYDDADAPQLAAIDAIKDGTTVTFDIYEDINGTPASIDSASGILTSVSVSWNRNEAATISGTITVTGTPIDLGA